MSASQKKAVQKGSSEHISGEYFERDLLASELDHIFQESPDKRTKDREKQLFGLAFSGGGIRSATFSLGVMQALAEQGWLKKFHYLSTVSGGSYIGSSLTWLCIRYGKPRTSTHVHLMSTVIFLTNVSKICPKLNRSQMMIKRSRIDPSCYCVTCASMAII
jgi:hypothetical protein